MPRGKKAAAETNGAQPKNNMDAMRQALATLGKDAMPVDLQKHLKDTWGIDMKTSVISNYKSTILNAKKPAKAAKTAAPQVAAKPAATGGISIDDITAVKAVVDRLGAEKVRQLAEVLA